MNSFICAYFHPSTVFIANTGSNYAKNLPKLLNAERVSFIKASMEDFIAFADKEILAQESYSIPTSIFDLPDILYDPARFQKPLAVIVDYFPRKPELIRDEIQLCRLIKDLNIGKIVVAPHISKKNYGILFGEKLVDGFVCKLDPIDIIGNLNAGMLRLQSKCFTSRSRFVFTEKHTFLSDRAYVDLFNQIYRNTHSVEYYLVDDNGSYVMLDDRANAHALFIRTQEETNNLVNLLFYQGVPQSLINDLNHGIKILCYRPQRHSLIPPISEVEKFLVNASKLENDVNKYYYAITQNVDNINLDRSRIVSFADYRASLPKS
ncbi:MAG: hypothetical protein LBI30_00015 [Holosporales bacterium]|nr:hypothetical protein [Holosporales bacterium]